MICESILNAVPESIEAYFSDNLGGEGESTSVKASGELEDAMIVVCRLFDEMKVSKSIEMRGWSRSEGARLFMTARPQYS